MAAQAGLSLHLSKCQIVGNLMPRLNFIYVYCIIFIHVNETRCIYVMIYLFIMLLKGAAHSHHLSVFQFLHLSVCLSALTEIYLCVLGFEALLEYF